MKKQEKIILIVNCVLIVGIIVYLVVRYRKSQEQILLLESENLRLQKIIFLKYQTEDGKIEKSVVEKEIEILISTFKVYSPETVMNLKRAQQLFREGHGEEAVKKLVVVIENKLKEVLKNDSWFSKLSEKRKKFVNISDLIKRAKEISIFDDVHSSVVHLAVDIRNGESHREGFKDLETKVQIGILGSIEAIKKLVPVEKNKFLKIA